MHFTIDRTVHDIAFDGSVVDHWLERKIAQTANASAMQARSDEPELCPVPHGKKPHMAYI